ncbi:hypothetical protein [Actinacidiphila acididurans]|uniref:Uncharacterized protein n=1 Tax=Actinacidiphila acididurans TaxID=2784346 RepID=A0ABS2TQ49_9ACTN|nr:hypothetical protein [Actinacidiphila acididurans]MBM9505458.1 hypothetical protein [Actinacidiphila acididurans]
MMRRLPWTTENGTPCYLNSGDSSSSFLSNLADGIESVQLGMGGELIDYVQGMLAAGEHAESEWRYVVTALCRALQEVIRVAESRGERLGPAGESDTEAARAARAVIDRSFLKAGARTATARDLT